MGVEPDSQNPGPSRFSPQHLSRWKALISDPWVLSTLSKGYGIQFRHQPSKFNGVRMTVVNDPLRSLALRWEILVLLKKGAVEYVKSLIRSRGFYSTYFLIPKKGGSFHLILNLRQLNQFVKVLHFHMLHTADVLQVVSERDWFTSINLKDAYFPVPVAPQYRQFLRFAFEGRKLGHAGVHCEFCKFCSSVFPSILCNDDLSPSPSGGRHSQPCLSFSERHKANICPIPPVPRQTDSRAGLATELL